MVCKDYNRVVLKMKNQFFQPPYILCVMVVLAISKLNDSKNELFDTFFVRTTRMAGFSIDHWGGA